MNDRKHAQTRKLRKFYSSTSPLRLVDVGDRIQAKLHPSSDKVDLEVLVPLPPMKKRSNTEVHVEIGRDGDGKWKQTTRIRTVVADSNSADTTTRDRDPVDTVAGAKTRRARSPVTARHKGHECTSQTHRLPTGGYVRCPSHAATGDNTRKSNQNTKAANFSSNRKSPQAEPTTKSATGSDDAPDTIEQLLFGVTSECARALLELWELEHRCERTQDECRALDKGHGIRLQHEISYDLETLSMSTEVLHTVKRTQTVFALFHRIGVHVHQSRRHNAEEAQPRGDHGPDGRDAKAGGSESVAHMAVKKLREIRESLVTVNTMLDDGREFCHVTGDLLLPILRGSHEMAVLSSLIQGAYFSVLQRV